MFCKTWPHVRVLASLSEQTKDTIMGAISDSPHGFSAVIRKDVYDTTALKQTQVGISVAGVGTNAARNAADIVLTEQDGFAGIVNVLRWSRNLQDCIRKFLQFQLTLVIVAVSTVFIGICWSGSSPLKSIHLFWMKVISQLLAPLALTSELPSSSSSFEDDLDLKSYGQNEWLVSRSLAKNIIGHSIFQLSILLTLLFAGESMLDLDSEEQGPVPVEQPPSQHLTIIFNTFAMMTLFNQINSRILYRQRNAFDSICSNRAFVGIWITTFVAQVFFVHFGSHFLSTVALTLEQWAFCLLFGIGELLWAQVLMSLPVCGACGEKKRNQRSDAVEAMQLISKKPYFDLEYDDFLDDSPLGLLLWRHGITRLQHQLRVARAFQNILEEGNELGSSNGSMFNDRSWRPSVLDEVVVRKDNDKVVKRQSQSTHNCSYLSPEAALHRQNHFDPSRLSFKSKSADDVISNIRQTEHLDDVVNKGIRDGDLAPEYYTSYFTNNYENYYVSNCANKYANNYTDFQTNTSSQS